MKKQKIRGQKKYKYGVFSVVLFLSIFAVGSLAFIFSMREIQHANAGRDLSQTVWREKLRLEASVNGEIALVLKMADSPLIQRYFIDPDNPDLEKTAFDEFAGYRRAFASQSAFWINVIDKKFYYNDSFVYIVDPNDPFDYWYNMTINETKEFNFNINYNPHLNLTDLWISAPVFNSNHRVPIGILGTGIGLSEFIDTIYRNYFNKAPMFFFNKAGEITGARDKSLVANKINLANELGKPGALIFSMLESLEDEEIQYFSIPGGVAALGAIHNFDWYVCAILPIGLKEILKTPMTILFAAMMFVVAGIIIIFNLIQINYDLNQERNSYRDKSIVDALTGIYNRRFLDENLEHIIKSLSRSEGKLSLLMLDVDYFKKYNDTYGHTMGDICLKTLANTIVQSITRADDFVARYGGEEFVIVLPNVDECGSTMIAERVLKNVREQNIPHKSSDAAGFVTVSIGGVTSIVDHSHTAHDYIRKADQALYTSKQNGRNRYTATDSV
ncbi:MAG: GGDEF domain-containing protein [Treponema sp.]|nr:GGDEF domain-containing protein [Treponema sp.]